MDSNSNVHDAPAGIIESPDAEPSPNLSLAQRRTRRSNLRLPQRYQNDPPTPLLNLRAQNPTADSRASRACISDSDRVQAPPKEEVLPPKCNKFGFFRIYHSDDHPSHDPDSEAQLSDILGVSTTSEASLLWPYPNKTAFLLGEWYWNGGIQKTKEGFKKLVDIICSQSFNPAEIKNLRWNNFDEKLGGPSDSDDMWFDEPDAGWTESTITLTIPFKQRSTNPGTREYTFPPFRHRSIVAILKEKMANKHDFKQFHLEPYELRWCRSKCMSKPDSTSTRVHGELYTSPAFIEENKKIQAAVGEPGCSLPRILVGLMFGSDGTKLTAFGSASLWPCYMYFGNESKYRRNKPSQNLCNHIAFFQEVCS